MRLPQGIRSFIGLLAVSLSVAAGAVAQPAPHVPSNLETITCSPAPCVIPPTQASEGGYEVANAPITADPSNPSHLLLGANDANCQYDLAAYVSPDGGTTWDRTCFIEGIGLYAPAGLPMVAYDRRGTAYVSSVYRHYGYEHTLVGIQSSTDGINWTAPVTALNKGLQSFDTWLTADVSQTSPYLDNLYISAVVGGIGEQVYVSQSSDGGASWTPVPVGPPQTTRHSVEAYTNIAVAANGIVYVSWLYCPGTGPHAGCADSTEYMLFSKSEDGGSTWSKPSLITSAIDVPNACMCWPFGPIPNTNVYASNIPAIVVDNSNGPYSGRLYVVMYSWTGTYMPVGVIHSSDGGTTWSKPVPVAPPSANHDQFFPWLSVSPTGLVGVSWLDRRNDSNNVNYQAFAAISSDGGQSFQPNVQLTTAFSNPNVNGYFGGGWMGDYTGNTWAGPNYFIAAWMDSSNGVDMQDYVGGIRLH